MVDIMKPGSVEPDVGLGAALRRRLMSGTAWVFAGKVTTSGVGIIVNALLARLLSPGEVGRFFVIFTVVFCGTTLCQVGLKEIVVRLVAEALSRGDEAQARAVMRAVISTGAFVAAGVTGAALIALLGPIHYAGPTGLPMSIVGLSGAWLLSATVLGLVTEALRGRSDFALAGMLEGALFAMVSAVIFASLHVAGAQISLRDALWCTVLANGGVCGCGLYVLHRRFRAPGTTCRSMKRRDLLSQSWPLGIHNVANFFLLSGADLWILGALRSAEEVAVYGAATKLVLLGAMPLLIVRGVAPTMIPELLSAGESRRLEKMLRLTATMAAAPSLAVAGAALVVGGPALGMIFGPFYRQGSSVLVILMIAQAASVAIGMGGDVLVMSGHQRTLMRISLASAACSVSANVLLGIHYGAVGVAWGTAIGLLVQNVLMLSGARRLTGLWTPAYLSRRAYAQGDAWCRGAMTSVDLRRGR